MPASWNRIFRTRKTPKRLRNAFLRNLRADASQSYRKRPNPALQGVALAASAALDLGLLALIGIWFLLHNSLPGYDGERRMTGIIAPVEIIRDARAVPHIHGATDQDVFFALGYVHAQDRLWQMELNRRAPQGRLSELFGRRALHFDRMMRKLDLYGYARLAARSQTPETRAVLEAYAAGVNAHIASIRGGIPGRAGPEFLVFGSEIDPWTPIDSMAVVKGMALLLSNGARFETRRARFARKLGNKLAAELFPGYPDAAIIALPEYAELFPGAVFPKSPESLSAASTALGVSAAGKPPAWPALPPPDPEAELAGASNAWAVQAERSATGAPLLASDPHLRLSAPSLWMLARLDIAGKNVIGATIPGIPAVILGHNADIAWGLTSTYADNQDVFIEKVNPENPDQYLTPEGWREFETRQDTITVRDDPPVPLLIQKTRHGPVISPEYFGTNPVTPSGHVAALRWTALAPEDRSLEMVLALMRATSIEEAAQTRGLLLAPVQNVTVADRNGVGMFTAGRIPLRNLASQTRGRVPSPGWIPENDWIGWMSMDRTPQVLWPVGGIVANANNRTTNAAYPDHITFDWGYPYRIRRIIEVLDAHRHHTPESSRKLQNDVLSQMAREILPLLIESLADTPFLNLDTQRRSAFNRLAGWNGAMDADAAQPLLFAAWIRALTPLLVNPKAGPLGASLQGPRPLFVMRVFRDIDGAAHWCDNPDTAPVENCGQIAWEALGVAVVELTERYGPRMDEWRWGEAHQAVQMHTPFSAVPRLRNMFDIRTETGGDLFTVMRGATQGAGDEPYANIHAGGFRAVYDFSDLDRSVYIQSTGQSGHVLSRFYDDMSWLWSNGEYIPMSLDPEQVQTGSVGTIWLMPDS